MATINQSDWAKSIRQVILPIDAAGIVVNKFTMAVAAAALVAGDIFEIGILPANHEVVDAIMRATDLDTDGTPAITLDAGIMSGDVGSTATDRTCGTELFSASTIGQAGGSAAVAATVPFSIAPSTSDRSLGIKVQTAPDVAAAGTLTLIVWSAAKA